jgi:hypothetical protein
MTQTRTRTPASSRQAPRSTPRLEPRASVRLTGRGAITALYILCFFTQLVADWANWGTLAGAAFVCLCGAVTYYTKTSGLRALVISPPLVFLAGCAFAQLLTSPGTFVAIEQTVVTLGQSAPWLFTAAVLAVVVAIGRGYRPALPRRSASGFGGPGRR